MTDLEFFARVSAAGFKGQIAHGSANPYRVEWTGHTETVRLVGERKDREITRNTGYATASTAVAAAESLLPNR